MNIHAERIALIVVHFGLINMSLKIGSKVHCRYRINNKFYGSFFIATILELKDDKIKVRVDNSTKDILWLTYEEIRSIIVNGDNNEAKKID